jgi:hypothetical protein
MLKLCVNFLFKWSIVRGALDQAFDGAYLEGAYLRRLEIVATGGHAMEKTGSGRSAEGS